MSLNMNIIVAQVGVEAVFGTLLVIAALAVFAIAFTLKNLIYICGPNEVLIFSGSKGRYQDQVIGYRLIKGGRGVRIPLLETVDRLNLTNLNIEIAVSGAYSKGGIPLNVQAVANVKVAGDEPAIHNAIERLLQKSRNEVILIAKETLEGNLRGVLATLTPEEVNEDKVKFAESLTVEAGEDFADLGLTLDSLKIQNVTDDQGYLSAIGRRQSAELEARSKIAEARSKAESAVQEANNLERTRLRQISEELRVVESQTKRRIIDAETKREALVQKEEAQVVALIARAEANLKVETARIAQTEQRLQAELIEPWIAQRDSMVFDARGKASEIVESGRAQAEAMRQIAKRWNEEGVDAKTILMLQKFGRITELLTSTMPKLKVSNMTVIDGDARQDADEGSLPVRAISALEQVRHATGLDLAKLSQTLTSTSAEDAEEDA